MTPMNDDYGDQFPGALPARRGSALPRTTGGEKRLVRMPAFDGHHKAGRQGTARTHGSRPPGQASTGLARIGRFTRRSLARFDRYTLEVFNAGSPLRPQSDR
jgi:hypothetical protein